MQGGGGSGRVGEEVVREESPLFGFGAAQAAAGAEKGEGEEDRGRWGRQRRPEEETGCRRTQ